MASAREPGGSDDLFNLRGLLAVERALRPGHRVGGNDTEGAHRGLEGADARRAGARAGQAKPRPFQTAGTIAPAPCARPPSRRLSGPTAARNHADPHWRDPGRHHVLPSGGRCRQRSRSRSSGKCPGSARSSRPKRKLPSSPLESLSPAIVPSRASVVTVVLRSAWCGRRPECRRRSRGCRALAHVAKVIDDLGLACRV